MNELKAGIYQHYKGPQYLVLGLAHDANDDNLYEYVQVPEAGGQMISSLTGREVVVYIGLQTDAAHIGARLAVRTLEDFFAEVCGNKDCMCYGDLFRVPSPEFRCSNYHRTPRFTYVDMRYTGIPNV